MLSQNLTLNFKGGKVYYRAQFVGVSGDSWLALRQGGMEEEHHREKQFIPSGRQESNKVTTADVFLTLTPYPDCLG